MSSIRNGLTAQMWEAQFSTARAMCHSAAVSSPLGALFRHGATPETIDRPREEFTAAHTPNLHCAKKVKRPRIQSLGVSPIFRWPSV
jgi:hypothetical protein